MYIYIYIYNNKEEKRLNKLFIRYAQIFGPAAFLGGEKTDTSFCHIRHPDGSESGQSYLIYINYVHTHTYRKLTCKCEVFSTRPPSQLLVLKWNMVKYLVNPVPYFAPAPHWKTKGQIKCCMLVDIALDLDLMKRPSAWDLGVSL